MPTHPSLWVRSSQPLLFSGSLLFTGVCVGRALTLGPEALLKKVRFRGLVGGPGTVLGEEETGTQEKQITHSSAGGGYVLRGRLLFPTLTSWENMPVTR